MCITLESEVKMKHATLSPAFSKQVSIYVACDYPGDLWVTLSDKKESQRSARACQFTQVAKLSVCRLDSGWGKRVFVYGASVSSHFSPPAQNRGLFMVVCRGKSGPDGRNLALRQGRQSAGAYWKWSEGRVLWGWLARSWVGQGPPRPGPGAGWRPHRDSEWETEHWGRVALTLKDGWMRRGGGGGVMEGFGAKVLPNVHARAHLSQPQPVTTTGASHFNFISQLIWHAWINSFRLYRHINSITISIISLLRNLVFFNI